MPDISESERLTTLEKKVSDLEVIAQELNRHVEEKGTQSELNDQVEHLFERVHKLDRKLEITRMIYIFAILFILFAIFGSPI